MTPDESSERAFREWHEHYHGIPVPEFRSAWSGKILTRWVAWQAAIVHAETRIKQAREEGRREAASSCPTCADLREETKDLKGEIRELRHEAFANECRAERAEWGEP